MAHKLPGQLPLVLAILVFRHHFAIIFVGGRLGDMPECCFERDSSVGVDRAAGQVNVLGHGRTRVAKLVSHQARRERRLIEDRRRRLAESVRRRKPLTPRSVLLYSAAIDRCSSAS